MALAPPPIDRSHQSPNRDGYSGKRRVDAVVWHITQGTNSLGWLCSPQSKASSNYLIARDGYIFELVGPDHDAWANGAVCKPDTGNALVAKWLSEGANFNTRTVSIEHEGFTSNGQGGSLTAAQIDATVALTAWLCERFRLTPDQTHILGHFQVDACNRPNCPGFSATEKAAWVARVARLVGGGTPAPNPPPPPFQHDPGFLDPLIDTFDWEGAGIVVYRKIRVYNDETARFYEREWSGSMGYSAWEIVG